MSDEFDNKPPKEATLIPVVAFKAFHNNFTGIQRTGEMKLTLTIPVDDIHHALDVATARDEILWVEVSKLNYSGPAIRQLADKIKEQDREREESRLKPAKKKKKAPTTGAIPSELDWET